MNKLKLVSGHEGCLQLSNEAKDRTFAIRFDGCIHIDDYCNETTYDTFDTFDSVTNLEFHDYLHICDLDEFIEQLIEVKHRAKEHFGENWPK